LSAFNGQTRRNHQATSTILKDPKRNPSKEDTRIKATVFKIPADSSDPVPALAIAAPTIPPINACEELLGIP
jgi:hypothetical protein